MLYPNLDFINVKERTLKLTVGGRGEWGVVFVVLCFLFVMNFEFDVIFRELQHLHFHCF